MSRGFHASWWQGTAAERGGFPTALLAVPFFWYETDTRDTYQWDGVAWLSIDVGGSGAAGQIAYWAGPSVIAGEGDFVYNPATNTQTVGNITVLSGGVILPIDAATQYLGDPTHRWNLCAQEIFVEASITTLGVTWIGYGAAAGRIVFNDAPAPDEITFSTCNVIVDNHITSGDYFTPDGGTFGIAGNELLTVNAAGNFTFSGVTSVVVPDGCWVGADAACSWVFDSTNGYVTTLDKVGVGTATPGNIIEAAAASATIECNATTGNATFLLSENGVAKWSFFYNTATNTFHFSEFGVGNWVTIVDGTGFFGLGTTGPDERLHVEGNILVDAYNLGEGSGIFFREGFASGDANPYNLSMTVRGWGTPASPDGFLISGYDGIGFMTGSGTYDAAKVRMLINPAGDIGIATLTPDTKFQVVGDLKVGDDNTNYVNIGTTGDVTFVGGAGLVFGSCYGNHINWQQAAAVQNTWYNVSDADMISGPLHNVTHDGNGKLTVTEPGMYWVAYSICFQDDAANDHVEAGIEVSNSGVAEAAGQCHLENKFANEEEHMGSGTTLDLADNATIEVCIRTTDAGTPTITVHAVNLTCVQIGGT